MKNTIFSTLTTIIFVFNFNFSTLAQPCARSLVSGPNQTTITYQCPDDILYLTATIPYNGIYAKGRAFTKFGAGNNGQYRKPIILVEGLDLDIGGNGDQGDRIGDRGWPNFISGISNERDVNDHILDNLPILINDLNAKGYDLIYLDHEEGSTYMQANAMVLVKLIQDINAIKVGNEPLTIVGASMGGQTTKYALGYMENNNIKHCVNEYIAFDSPHQGANMPMSLQKFVDHYAPLKTDISVLKDKLNSPAAQQLLIAHAAGGYTAASPLRGSWLADLNAVGVYPKKTRNVSVINGSNNSIQVFSKGSVMMNLDIPSLQGCNNYSAINAFMKGAGTTDTYTGKRPIGHTNTELITNYIACDQHCLACLSTPELFYEKESLSSMYSPNYDGCPGSLRNTQDAIWQEFRNGLQGLAGDLGIGVAVFSINVYENYHSFVPTISALDINTTDFDYNVSNTINPNVPNSSLHPFEAFYAPSNNNEFHIEFTGNQSSGNIKWIIDEMASVESKLFYVNYILTNNSSLSNVYNSGIYNFGRLANKRELRSLQIISGGKLLVNNNLLTDFGNMTPGSPPHINGNTTSPYNSPIAGSTYTLETCDCNNVVVNVDNNGEFILGDNNGTNNNKAIVLFHEGSKLIVKNGGKLTIRKGSKLVMEENTMLTLEQGGQIIIEQGGEIVIKGTSQFISSGQITINGGKITQEPLSKLDLNGTSKLVVNDNSQVIIQADLSNPNATVNGLLTYNQGAIMQLKGDNAVLEINGRLHIGDNATFGFTYPGSNSGYIKFNRGQGVWWDNWAPNNAHITCGTNARINLQGKGKTDKMIDISQINVAIPKNLAQFTMAKCQVEFNEHDAQLETDRPTFINTSTFIRGNAINGRAGRGLLVFGQQNCIINNCDFIKLFTGVTGALFYSGTKLTGVKGCKFEDCDFGAYTIGGGVDLRNNTFYDNLSSITALDATSNNLITNNVIDLNLKDPNLFYAVGIGTRGPNVEFEIKQNTVNQQDIGVAIVNSSNSLRCNDLQNNRAAIIAGENCKINMSDLLGAGYNNANNCEIFATLVEANTFEADQGFNNFQIANGGACIPYPQSGHGPNITPAYTVCPTIMEGSLINFIDFNPLPFTHNYQIFAEQNFWRPLSSATDVIEDRQNKVRKIDLTDINNPIIDSASIYTGNVLTNSSLVTCPTGNGGSGCVGPACRLAVHPLDDNSNSSVITTASFYNKKLQKALQFSLNKMDKMQNSNKVNQAADLLTECLTYNYATPVTNSVDKYLLELAYQKLFTCVAQLAEWHRDSSITFNPMPVSLQSRFNDLHTICALRAGRKSIAETDYKEINDLILLDKAMVYRISDNRQIALSIVNNIIASSPKSSHLKMYESFRCMWSTEQEAINGNISVDKAIEQVKLCNEKYSSVPKQTLSSARKINTKKESEVIYADDYAIAVFPNPTMGSLSVAYSLKEFKLITFEIFDAQGKKVKAFSLNPDDKTINIDNLNLENGVYFYMIQGDEKNLMTKKLVIVK